MHGDSQFSLSTASLLLIHAFCAVNDSLENFVTSDTGRLEHLVQFQHGSLFPKNKAMMLPFSHLEPYSGP